MERPIKIELKLDSEKFISELKEFSQALNKFISEVERIDAKYSNDTKEEEVNNELQQ